MAKLTALGGSRCAAMTWVTCAGTSAPVAAHAQGGVLKINASAARSNTFDLQAVKPITLLN
jgi:hypothetical protein